MSAPDPGKVMVEFVTGGETCVRVMLIVKYKEEESAASMAVKKTVFSLVILNVLKSVTVMRSA